MGLFAEVESQFPSLTGVFQTKSLPYGMQYWEYFIDETGEVVLDIYKLLDKQGVHYEDAGRYRPIELAELIQSNHQAIQSLNHLYLRNADKEFLVTLNQGRIVGWKNTESLS